MVFLFFSGVNVLLGGEFGKLAGCMQYQGFRPSSGMIECQEDRLRSVKWLVAYLELTNSSATFLDWSSRGQT